MHMFDELWRARVGYRCNQSAGPWDAARVRRGYTPDRGR
jgi:hypothetical protein